MKKIHAVLALVCFLAVLCPLSALADNEVEYDDVTATAQLVGKWLGDTANVSAIDVVGNDYKDLLVSRYEYLGHDEFDSMLFEMIFVHPIEECPVFLQYDDYYSSANPDVNTTGYLCADFNNDGYNDFYAPHPSGGRLYMNSGSSLTDVTSSSTGLGAGSIGAVWGDFNGDSFVDLLVLGGSDADIESPGSVSNVQHLFINIPVSAGSSERKFEKDLYWPSTSNVGSALAGDFDGDADIDIVLVQSSPSTPLHDYAKYYENTGDYSSPYGPSFWFTDESDDKFANLGESWNSFKCAAAICDYNNNGNLDIVFINSGKYGFLENDGNGVFSPGLVETIGAHAGDIGIFDFDLDGRDDFIKGITGSVDYPLVYRNMATAENDFDFVNYTGEGSLDLPFLRNTRGLCLSDLTGNGLTEVFFARRNNTNTPALLHQAEPKTGSVQNNWVGMKLTSPGEIDNFRCIGATVHVYAGSHHHANVVDGGMGRASQRDLDLVFGLGDYTGTVDVEAFFPSGAHFELSGLTPNQYHFLELNTVSLDNSSVDFEILFNVSDATEDWVFTWKTSDFSDNAKDGVHIEVIDGEGVEYRGGASGPYDPLDYYGSESMTKQVDGTWLHRLVIPCVVCDPGRKIEYSVSSKLGPSVDSSSIRTYQAPKFCLAIQ
jgi:hypothetical protein